MDQSSGTNNLVLRDLNMNSIFRTIQHGAPISRVDISEQTKLAQSTVSTITGELQESGFIRDCGHSTSTGGRRRILLEINPEGGYFICADLSGSKIRIGVLDLSFRVVKEWVYENTTLRGENLLKDLISAISQARNWCDEKELRILSIGIATPGVMDSSTGMIVEASNLDWHQFKLIEFLEQKFQLPVIVENDTNAAAYGEFSHRSERDDEARNMLYIAVDTGVGAGLIMDKRLYKGSSGLAGEIGHVVVRIDGEMCSCGKRGCLETLVSERAVLRDYNNRVGSAVTNIYDIVKRSESGDSAAYEVLSNVGQTLGLVIGNQINILNSDHVVFAGSVTQGRVVLDAISQSLHQVLLPGFMDNLHIRKSALNDNAGYVGIAYLSLASTLNKYGFKYPATLDSAQSNVTSRF